MPVEAVIRAPAPCTSPGGRRAAATAPVSPGRGPRQDRDRRRPWWPPRRARPRSCCALRGETGAVRSRRSRCGRAIRSNRRADRCTARRRPRGHGARRKRMLRDVFIGTTIKRVMRTGRHPVLMVNRAPTAPWRPAVVASDLPNPLSAGPASSERPDHASGRDFLSSLLEGLHLRGEHAGEDVGCPADPDLPGAFRGTDRTSSGFQWSDVVSGAAAGVAALARQPRRGRQPETRSIA